MVPLTRKPIRVQCYGRARFLYMFPRNRRISKPLVRITKSCSQWQVPENGNDITNYKIYQGTTSNTEKLAQTVGNVTSAAILGLMNNKLYYFVVAAVNGTGTGEFDRGKRDHSGGHVRQRGWQRPRALHSSSLAKQSGERHPRRPSAESHP